MELRTLSPELCQSVSKLVAQATATLEQPVVSSQRCSGGCIHRAQLLELQDGRLIFVKYNRGAASMFRTEADGLARIADTETLRTPMVLAQGQLDETTDCLVLEGIRQGRPNTDFWEIFGRGFAQLHRSTHDRYGLEEDNFIGSSKQPNTPTDHWVELFAEQRLGYQLKLVRQRSLGSIELYKRMDRLISKLDNLLGPPSERPSLLHGDLWSGNYMVDADGLPVVFDPAAYYGDREADLAMPQLFGGFPTTFFDAYHEAWSLRDGWRDRVAIYQLYHLLNHLNLFGNGYLDSCLEIARRY